MKKIKLGVVFMIISTTMMAQMPKISPEAKEQIQKFAKLEGTWKGSGYNYRPDGEKEEFEQLEKASFILDGTAILFEGKAVDSKDTTKIVHQALGVFYYDVVREGFFLDAHISLGYHTYAQAKIDEQDRLVWWFETPTGDTIRYIIEIKDNVWKEDGVYIQKNSDQERTFFHMELNKI